jgi:hypothetical protein
MVAPYKKTLSAALFLVIIAILPENEGMIQGALPCRIQTKGAFGRELTVSL